MVHGLFVTGTGTNVGKTVAAAALMHRYRYLGRLRYWKPIQTGIDQDDDTAVVQWLGNCSPDELLRKGVRLSRPLSPHLAAQLHHVRIDIAELLDCFSESAGTNRWVVEGAGGVLVPINESELMIDLIARLSLPVVVVAASTLGTINHTLLTLDALRSRGLQVAGVIMVGEKNPGNRDAIEYYGRTAVVGEIPHFPILSVEALRDWVNRELDAEGQLSRHLI